MADNYLPNTTEYAISPYSSYASNNVNKLTRVSTLSNNCVLGGIDSLEITITGGGLSLSINPGRCVIDDTYIELKTAVTVDLLDNDNYINNEAMTEIGSYYVCLYYKYLKSRTFPQATIKIFPPSLRNTYNPIGYYLLLKVASVTNPGVGRRATAVANYDSGIGYEYSYKRYKRNYAEFYDVLPPFGPEFIGRFIVVKTLTDYEMYVGSKTEWVLYAQQTGTYAEVQEKNANPTILDDEYPVGTIWVNMANDTVWICAHQASNSSIWIQCVTPTGSFVDAIALSRNPTITDSSYTLPSVWVNTTTDAIFICTDKTPGAAIWRLIRTGTDPVMPDVTEILRSRFLL